MQGEDIVEAQNTLLQMEDKPSPAHLVEVPNGDNSTGSPNTHTGDSSVRQNEGRRRRLMMAEADRMNMAGQVLRSLLVEIALFAAGAVWVAWGYAAVFAGMAVGVMSLPVREEVEGVEEPSMQAYSRKDFADVRRGSVGLGC
jgi:hypothetical protein